MDILKQLFMGSIQSTKKVNYEDIQNIIKGRMSGILLLNSLDLNEQKCLIPNTLDAHREEEKINSVIRNLDTKIIIYGKNTSDKNLEKKYLKLIEIGFANIYIYPGGLFEWLCLQDIYGRDDFPTTSDELDILKYKPESKFY
jgi:hypothetical protein